MLMLNLLAVLVVYKINMSSGPEGAETGFSSDPAAHLTALNL